jgi:hypothetical protein
VLRQLNIRVPEDVYEVERLIAQRYDMSLAQYVAELVRLDAEQNLELAAQAAREAAEDAARQADRLEQQMQRPAQKVDSLVARYRKNHR